jgi:hypothetical protein
MVMEEWTRIGQEWQQLREHPNPTITLDAVCGMSTPILALLESSLIADSGDLHGEMLGVLSSGHRVSHPRPDSPPANGA